MSGLPQENKRRSCIWHTADRKRQKEEGEEKCLNYRKIWRAEEVHHIQELKEHPELGLDDDNLVSLCTQCHNLRHGRAPKRFARKKKLPSEERW